MNTLLLAVRLIADVETLQARTSGLALGKYKNDKIFSEAGVFLYSSTIESLQRAAIDLAFWPNALEVLSRETGSAGAILIPIENRIPGLLSSPNMQDVLGGYFDGGWNLRDERYRGVPTMLRKGVAVEADFIASQDIDRSAYYRDFLERYGLRWFAGIGFKLGGELWCVALQRRIDQGPFVAQEIAQLEGLLVPLHDAATVSQKLASAHVTGMLDAVELMDRPCLVLDKKARIISMNQKAEAILAGSIDVRNAKLQFRDAQSNDNFSRLISNVIQQTSRSPPEAWTTILDHRAEAHVVRAVSLGEWADLLFTGARLLLILRSLRAKPVDPALLKAHFGLTTAEARLASAVSSGLSIRSAAASTGVTYETARSSIKTIYSKTNSGGREELMALLLKFDV